MDEFKFKMQGPLLDKGIPLHVALSSLQDVQSIFDKSYLVLTGGKIMNQKDREQFYLNTYNIQHGCLESDLKIVLDLAQHSIPVLTAHAASDIWGLTQKGWGFLKYVYELAEQGRQPTYQANQEGSIIVINGNDNQVFAREVVDVGRASVPHWRSLNHKLKQGRIENYSMGNVSNPEITLGHNSRTIFDNPSKIDTQPLTIVSDIFDFNKRENVGKLSVLEGDLPDQDFSFKVLGDQDRVDFISSMLKSSVEMTVLREIIVNPLGESWVKCLHILEIHNHE